MSTQVRERVSRIQIRSGRGARRPFGLTPAEIIVACLALIIFTFVVIYYFSSLRPEQERLSKTETEYERIRIQLKGVPQNALPQAPEVDSGKVALDSLEQFKSAHLKPVTQTKIALFNEINALARNNKVILASGIELAEQNLVQTEKQKDELRGKGQEAIDLFPKLAGHFTVAGEYASLRQFIRDLESSKQFVVINSINLINQEGKQRGEEGPRLVSGITLTIDFTAPVRPGE